MYTIVGVLGIIANVIYMLVIVQFIVGLLFAFNVVNSRNQVLWQIHNSIDALLEPLLRPIRRVLPNTGAIDFSPLALLVLLNIVMFVLRSTV